MFERLKRRPDGAAPAELRSFSVAAIEGKRRRLVVVLETYPSLSETFVYQTLQSLERAGFQVILLARKRGPKDHHRASEWKRAKYLPRETKPVAWKLLCLGWLAVVGCIRLGPFRLVRFVQRVWRGSRNARDAFRRLYLALPLLQSAADVFYFPFGGIAAKYQCFVEAWEGPIALSARGSDVHVEPLVNGAYRQALREVLRRADGVHCVSHAIRARAEELAGRPLPRAAVVHTGVDAKLIKERRVLEKRGSDKHTDLPAPLKIISVGRLHWIKGYEHGLMAACELRDRGVGFYWQIVAEGPHRRALEYAIRDMGLERCVELAGPSSKPGSSGSLQPPTCSSTHRWQKG